MNESVDRFYIGYFTGASGTATAVFVLMNGKVVGSDVHGAKLDGNFQHNEVSNTFSAKVTVDVLPNSELIQGGTTGASGLIYTVEFEACLEKGETKVFRVNTPAGPINARLVKIREI